VDFTEVQRHGVNIDHNFVGGGDGFVDIAEAKIGRGLRVIDDGAHGFVNAMTAPAFPHPRPTGFGTQRRRCALPVRVAVCTRSVDDSAAGYSANIGASFTHGTRSSFSAQW
jgi:hypothetical protein